MPICIQCNEQLTIKHIVLQYPKFSQSRSNLNHPTTMEIVLGEHNIHQIYLFFKAIEYITKI